MTALAPGHRFQVYRAKLPGKNVGEQRKALAAALAKFKQLGCPGVVYHGFSTELPAVWDVLARMAADAGLDALAAFGLDDTDAAGKGARLGAVAVKLSCTGVVFDAEGAWEHATKIEESQRALAMRLAFRHAAPDALAIDQPWPVPTVHWSVWPHEQFASLVQYRAEQRYYQDWKEAYGAARFARCEGEFDHGWSVLESRLAPQGLVRPRIATMQGYGWADILADLVTALLRYPSAILWVEPFPDASVVRGLQIVQALAAAGCAGPDAVRRFQGQAKLDADGVCGDDTLKALGA